MSGPQTGPSRWPPEVSFWRPFFACKARCQASRQRWLESPPEPTPRRHPMQAQRRTALALLALAAAAALTTPALAQDSKYPSKPVTLVVPQVAGRANDAIARIVAQKLSETLGQQLIVDNRPGAGGNIGTAASSGDAVEANKHFAPNNIAELITSAKAAPGKINIASAGNGTVNHLFGEMLGKAAGIDMTHVPYKGASAAVTDLVGGTVQVSVQSLPSSIAFIKGGKLKVLAVVNEKRIAALPEVPTVGETVKNLGYTPWYGVFAPAGTPKAIVAQLQAAIGQVLDAPDVREKLAGIGCEPLKIGPEPLAALIRKELPRWAKVVKEADVTLD